MGRNFNLDTGRVMFASLHFRLLFKDLLTGAVGIGLRWVGKYRDCGAIVPEISMLNSPDFKTNTDVSHPA